METFGRAALVVADSREQAQIECGDLVEAVRQGVIAWGRVSELGEVVVGTRLGRESRQGITVFEPQGLAMEDVAVGARVLERAQSRGRQVEFGV